MRLNRRTKILLVLGGTLLLIAGITFGILSILQRSGSDTSSLPPITNLLPGAGEQNRQTPPPASENIDDTSPEPQLENPQHGQGDNLAAVVRYTRGSVFTLTLDTVAQTSEAPTIQYYEPLPGNPFSLLRLVGENNDIVAEYRFAMPTSGIGEGFGSNPDTNALLDTASAYLVVDVPPGASINRVEIVTENGRLLDEETFSLQTRGLNTLQGLFSRITQHASAQPSSQFTIVVINERGVNGVQGMAQTVRGITQIEPWATFADRLNVVPISNRANLGCTTTDTGYPVCDDAQVRQAIGTIVPDVIIVLAPQACECGFVQNVSSNMMFVGTNASSLLIAHELGHTVGKLVDEYLHEHGQIVAPFSAPNCFDSLSTCQEAIAPYAGRPGAQCSLGCSTVSNYRPATRLMHNEPGPHGPLEECIVGRAIASAVGTTYDCPELATTPSPPVPGEPGDFWGWFR